VTFEAEKATQGKKVRLWATRVVVGGLILIFLLDIASVWVSDRLAARIPPQSLAGASPGVYRLLSEPAAYIHFLDVGNADAILLESDGHFALIDAGWGPRNPDPRAAKNDTSAAVLRYLRKYAAPPQGEVVLDWVLVTHYHYDHAGGFERILADAAVTIQTAYLRGPDPGRNDSLALDRWDVAEIQRRLTALALERAIPVVQELPTEPFQLGSLTVQLLNTDSYQKDAYVSENDNSVAAWLHYGETSALLAGDATYMNGLEKHLADITGRVDLLKLNHHGYTLSNSFCFVRKTHPAVAIATNDLGRVFPDVKWKFSMFIHTPLYATGKEKGIIAALQPAHQIKLFSHTA
jgi:beta-lactamase superfamily II metal-dependent hydrolase